jgi:hypothetical protein
MNVDDHLRMLEEKMLLSSFRQNSNELADLLTDDFQEFGSSGRIFDKAAILRELRDELPAQLALRDFEATTLAKSVVHVTYIATRWTAQAVTESVRSSIWVHRDGAWRMRFHQGTQITTREF